MSNMRVPPFTPNGLRTTVHMTVSSVSETMQFDGFSLTVQSNQSPSTTQVGGRSNSVRLFNAGPSTVFFELVGSQGDRTAVAGSSVPLAPNASEKFTTSGATWIAAVTATISDTATLYATPGEGL